VYGHLFDGAQERLTDKLDALRAQTSAIPDGTVVELQRVRDDGAPAARALQQALEPPDSASDQAASRRCAPSHGACEGSAITSGVTGFDPG